MARRARKAQPNGQTEEEDEAASVFDLREQTDDERERLKRLGASGFVDLFRARYPEQQAFSWWDYRGGAFHKKQGLRIDLIYGTPALADRVKDVVIDRDFRKKQLGLTASDHAPVWVDLT